MLTLASLTESVILQRQEKLIDNGPQLRGIGSAKFGQNQFQMQIAGASCQPGKAPELVKRALTFANSHMQNISWTFLPEREDHDIAAALEHEGFAKREDLRLMGKIGELNTPKFPAKDVETEPIRSIYDMKEYERIAAWGFNNQQYISNDYLTMRSGERWEEQQSQWYQYYIGKISGQVVSGAYISLWERVPTIYGVVTIPTARGRGAAGSVMIALVKDIIGRGFPWTCLYVALGNPAEKLYTDLGYTFLLTLSTYYHSYY